MDSVQYEVLANLERTPLRPDMNREFNEETVEHIYRVLMPSAIESGDAEVAKLAEEVLRKYGYAIPNTLTGAWIPKECPATEAQVREMYAHRMPEFGYEIVRSGEHFPDWLLVSGNGKYVYAEVEHRSSAFIAQCHDPAMCDLVVCWEHDCDVDKLGVPVLELFTKRTTEPSLEAKVVPGDRGRLSVHWAGRNSKPHPKAGNFKYGKDLTSSSRYKEVALEVERLKASGLSTKAATSTVANKLGLAQQTIYSYISRYKKIKNLAG